MGQDVGVEGLLNDVEVALAGPCGVVSFDRPTGYPRIVVDVSSHYPAFTRTIFSGDTAQEKTQVKSFF